MGPQPKTSSLRRVRTFQDDMRRAQGDAVVDVNDRTTATSVVAPTVNVRSVGPVPAALAPTLAAGAQRAAPRGGMKATLSSDLMDIRNVAGGTEEATIVSERKAKKWSFSAAVRQSMSSWWKETLEEIKEETGSRPTPTSHEIPRIAQTAPPMHAVVAPDTTTPAIPPESVTAASSTPEPVAAWTHIDAPPATMVREPAPKLARPIIRPATIDIQSGVTPVARTTPDQPVIPPSGFRTSSAPVTPVRQASPREWAETALPPEENLDVTLRAREAAIREESAKFAARAKEAALRRKEYEASQPTSSGSKYFVYGTLTIIMLSLVVLLGAGGYALWSRQGPIADAPEPGIDLLFAVSESVGIPLITSRSDFMLDLTRRVAESEGAQGSFVRYYFYYQNDRSETELPAQAFLDVLDLRAPGSMLRTIDPQMTFGAYIDTENAPYIVFKVRNYEEALGGMLLFEPNINSDLAPLMGENLGRVGQLGQFRDEVIGGIDTRSLYDDFGNRVLMYALINRDTLVITTSPAALVSLSQVLK